MKYYEIARRSLEPVLPPLYARVRRDVLSELRDLSGPTLILDVGGRKSPYTIGVPARVHILDLPRESEIQNELNLGLNDQVVGQIQRRRSNIDKVILGNMTRSGLPSNAYDIVVSVEVLEHVERDELFVDEVCRVLKPGGVFIMTTPNGDFIENRNPDHKRHYKLRELAILLDKFFERSELEYAIAGGYFRKAGLRPWAVRRPIQTLASIFGNVVNSIQSASTDVATKAIGTHHLIAKAYKRV